MKRLKSILALMVAMVIMCASVCSTFAVDTNDELSEASKKLYISQSAVSQSIKTLEKKLGQSLFIRSTKKVQLTPAGSLLLKHIEIIYYHFLLLHNLFSNLN